MASILALIVIGLMSGHKGYTSIVTWARSQPELTEVLSFRFANSPRAAAIHNLLKHLDVVSLEAALTKCLCFYSYPLALFYSKIRK
ncbi:hypothetical protein C6503_26480 [Candidatus Poribacteria bacterium]|nr:MAG: hypothetical protein C6503_26480 [Candidatus Poribacteria bacterium]